MSLPNDIMTIGWSAFSGCAGLQNISFTEKLAYIDSYAFYSCTNLTNISIPEGVEILKSNTINQTGLTTISFPSTLTNIDGDNLSEKIQTIYSYAVDPPSITLFSNTISPTCTVYVPDASVDLYKAAEVWKDGNVLPLSQAQ